MYRRHTSLSEICGLFGAKANLTALIRCGGTRLSSIPGRLFVLGMHGPPRDCKGKFGREDKSAQMYSLIRAKVLSRAEMSYPLR